MIKAEVQWLQRNDLTQLDYDYYNLHSGYFDKIYLQALFINISLFELSLSNPLIFMVAISSSITNSIKYNVSRYRPYIYK